jgi:hypothetical protein
MIMGGILLQGMAQGALTAENPPRQHCICDGSHPALRVGMQIWRARWQNHALYAGIINNLLKRGAELGVAVVDEILA